MNKMRFTDPITSEEVEDLQDAVSSYLENAFEEVVEAKERDDDPWDEAAALHCKRNEFLLKESPVHDQNDHRACLQARLLNIVREKRMSRYKGDELRDNIRQIFEINSELQSMIAQSKHENNKPSLLFCNLKEFHDESYQQFLEDLNRRLKPDSESLKSK